MRTYSLRDTDDPEERLEDAAMFKALYDATRGEITPAPKGKDGDFGCTFKSRFKDEMGNPYWRDPAFIANCGRDFETVTFDGLIPAIERLRAKGKAAYLKAGLMKFWSEEVGLNENIMDAIGNMAFSFIDTQIPIMVQELVDFEFEHRFFIYQRRVLTHSPAAYTLTPLDFPLPSGIAWRKQADKEPCKFDAFGELLDLANHMATNMAEPDGVVDIGMINDKPAVVEINPWRVGMFGLFACDVRAIAKAVVA